MFLASFVFALILFICMLLGGAAGNAPVGIVAGALLAFWLTPGLSEPFRRAPSDAPVRRVPAWISALDAERRGYGAPAAGKQPAE
ncbi:MAG: hypothetical protein ACFB22_15345 [Rhodothalassiaceae bacterium]